MEGLMRISADGDMCTGHGRCYSLAPQLLHYDDQGFVTIRDVWLEVPSGQEDAAAMAVLSCPEDALRIER
jgi:ferredoxin